MLERTSSKQWKAKLPDGRRYFQIISVIKGLYLKYIKNLYDSMMRWQLSLKTGKDLNRHFSKKRYIDSHTQEPWCSLSLPRPSLFLSFSCSLSIFVELTARNLYRLLSSLLTIPINLKKFYAGLSAVTVTEIQDWIYWKALGSFSNKKSMK